MTVKKLFEEIKNQTLQSLYLFHGQEEFAKDKAVAAIIKSLQNPSLKEFNVDVLDKPTENQITLSCENLPLMDDKRIVIINNSNFFNLGAPQIKEFAKYLTALPKTTCCVFVERDKCDERKAFFKSFPKQNVVNFEHYSQGEAANFAVDVAKKMGCEFPKNVALKLVAMTGNALQQVNNETQKVCAYCNNEKLITQEALEICVNVNLEYSVFKMLDLFIDQKFMSGMNLLHEKILNEGAGVAISILMFFASRFRLMLCATNYIQNGETQKTAAELLKINPYAAKMTIQQSLNFSQIELENAMLCFAQADFEIKTGKSKDVVALEMALCKIFLK